MVKNQDFYRYIRLRDECGDARGAVDVLDFPAVQEEEKQEYTVFLDILEEEFKGREILALQEYRDFSSPIGEPLFESRSTVFRKSSSVEDFVNPLDEPSQVIPYKFNVTHAYVYKQDDNLCVVRLSHNKAEGDFAMKETLYDITDLPSKERRVMYSSVSRSYMDKDCFYATKKMLDRNHCGLGEKIVSLYKDRMKKRMNIDFVKDIYLPAKYRNQHSIEGLDAVFLHTNKATEEEIDKGKDAILAYARGQVLVYSETEYWYTVKDKEGKTETFTLGIDVSTMQFEAFTKGVKSVWNDGNDLDYGTKDGDIALRMMEHPAKVVLSDGTEIEPERVTVMRLIPITKKQLPLVEEINQEAVSRVLEKGLQNVRYLVGIHSREEWDKAIGGFVDIIEQSHKNVVFMREKINQALPAKVDMSKVFQHFSRDKKMFLDEALAKVLTSDKFRKNGINEAKQFLAGEVGKSSVLNKKESVIELSDIER